MNEELAATVIEPYFDAVRDTFVEHGLDDLRRTRMEIDSRLHRTPRSFGACRDDGKLILLAPQAAELPWMSLAAILAHEFGHAADFAYPGHWILGARENDPATWIDRPRKGHLIWWQERDDDQVEMSADAISYAVTGVPIRYCGKCLVQCFDRKGKKRPKGLR